MVTMEEMPLASPLADALSQPPHRPDAVSLDWLGQAGFAIRGSGPVLVIDPYLSDSLAEMYPGGEFNYKRMMPSPLAPEEMRGISVVLCTHRHTDHMDPGTLPVLARGNPRCVFVVPRAEKEYALGMGIPEARLRGMDAGESLQPVNGVQVEAIAAAHEELARNARGELLHLGYIITIGAIRIYHSGDCVPYKGLGETLRARSVDVALLPINGRSSSLTSRGIIGNFFLEETVDLCRSAGIGLLFCHHWGMFDFNTVDPQEAARKLAKLDGAVRCVMPRPGVRYLLEKR
jgi:L-ascorbate metabolism protein UlaG (beta-lactamase superfamily)